MKCNESGVIGSECEVSLYRINIRGPEGKADVCIAVRRLNIAVSRQPGSHGKYVTILVSLKHMFARVCLKHMWWRGSVG